MDQQSHNGIPHPQNGTIAEENLRFEEAENIKWILCISGKRKSGKDFVTRRLAQLIGERLPHLAVSICILSEPLKEEFAQLHGLDAIELMSDGEAKEKVRREMIAFGEKLRGQDAGIFCRKALPKRHQLFAGSSPNGCAIPEAVLVSDCRRPTDIYFFRNSFPNTNILCIRVDCPLEMRIKRGFSFTPGVDDAESECALDTFDGWDFKLCNDREGNEELDAKLNDILCHLNEGTR